MNAHVIDPCLNIPVAMAVMPSLTPAIPGGRLAARPLALMVVALGLSLAGCGAGGICGFDGLGNCPEPKLEVSIDVAVADVNGDGRADVIQPISNGVNDPGTIATWLQSNGGYGPRHDFSAGA